MRRPQYDHCGPEVQSCFSRRRLILATAAVALLPALPSRPSAAPEGPLSFLSTATAVIDGRSLRLADGRDLILPHILPPGPDRHAPIEDGTDRRMAARALADLVLGHSIRVDLSDPGQDRYGRLRGRISVMGQDTGEPDIASQLAASGHVRVFPEPGADPDRIAELVAAETRGRLSGAGFWGTGRFILYDAAALEFDPDFGADRFEVLTGTVQRTSRIGTRDHLEFGSDWRTDFTAGLASNIRRQAEREGWEIDAFARQPITLRGWIRTWNGPFMEIDQMCQITRPA